MKLSFGDTKWDCSDEYEGDDDDKRRKKIPRCQVSDWNNGNGLDKIGEKLGVPYDRVSVFSWVSPFLGINRRLTVLISLTDTGW